MTNTIPIVILLGFTTWSVFSIYLFSSWNGTFDSFGRVLDTCILDDGTPLLPRTTNGWSPQIDWQIRAPAAFLWGFAGNGLNPDTSLAGYLFAGAWAPSWILIVLESLRRGNRRRVISFVSIWGIFQFQNAHAVVTPLYLAVHLFTSPSANQPRTEDILVEGIDLMVLPASFIIGFVFPIILVALPAPSAVSIIFKQSIMGWYQQWNLYIALAHVLLATGARLLFPASIAADPAKFLKLYRQVYAFALGLAAIGHLPVMVMTCTAALWPGLFKDEFVSVLSPSHILIPTSPFSGLRTKNLTEGMFWLIQWDYFSGTFSHVIWATVVYLRARSARRLGDSAMDMLRKAASYFLIAGPIGIAVGLIWERDELLIAGEKTAG